MATTTPLIPVSQTDYLEEDKPIRGQNYVCLSFVSPEDILVDKEVYFFNKFISSFSNDVKNLINTLRDKYPDDTSMFNLIEENHGHFFKTEDLQEQFKFYKGTNCDSLETEFHKEQNYRPTIRGIKVRGVFDTLKEAQVRSEVLKKMGDKFDIYVAQVGCWCPWSPNPGDLEDQQYAETSLNTLMMKYKENIEAKDTEFDKRKEAKMNQIKEDNDRRKVVAELDITG
jgi:5'(3')-deoxyribonucleotidase